jgi:hypothetical protein
VSNQAYVFAMNFNDSGIAVDIPTDASGAEMFAEAEGSADGQIHTPENATIVAIDDEIAIADSVTVAGVKVSGVYRLIYTPEDKTGTAKVLVASQFDEDASYVEIEVEEPTASMWIYPPGIDASLNTDQHIIVQVYDHYGRAITDLTSQEDYFTLEIDNDDYGFTAHEIGGTTSGVYAAKYNAPNTGSIDVEWSFNDEKIAEGTFVIVE